MGKRENQKWADHPATVLPGLKIINVSKFGVIIYCDLPSGKRLHNYGKIHHFIAGKIPYEWPFKNFQ